jgi:hypothetical protein
MRWLPLALLIACGGGDDDTSPDGPEPGPFEVMLGDPEGCAPSIALKPETSADLDTWIGGRLTPPAYPARVDSIKVGFDGRVPCSITVPSVVRAAIGGAEPPESPTPAVYAEIEASGSNGPGVVYTLEVGGEQILQQGQHLYVYVQVQGTAEQMRCLTLCQDIDKSDQCFWSGSSAPPFDWRNIDQVGQLALSMKGETLAE